ncbi:hypothetical protein ZEAMMB73_Zm00001d029710 [Zea mays]|uniref:Uncharacterized protein n=1 Tax=Zea mays TaxID=4577 RepID=A0A1D6K7C6_MAIZE|nr:hypothetical protein ZEAMMB73_Zm00001d029710 [Zea mays]
MPMVSSAPLSLAYGRTSRSSMASAPPLLGPFLTAPFLSPHGEFSPCSLPQCAASLGADAPPPTGAGNSHGCSSPWLAAASSSSPLTISPVSSSLALPVFGKRRSRSNNPFYRYGQARTPSFPLGARSIPIAAHLTTSSLPCRASLCNAM